MVRNARAGSGARWSAAFGWLASLGLPVFLLMASAVPTAHAQQGVPVDYGATVSGTVPADGAQTAYAFTGNPGDLVMARVVAQTPGMTPTVTLLGPDQATLVSSETDPPLLTPSDAVLVFRLITPGTYTLVVSGTAGDFVLTVQVRPVVVLTLLALDTPTVAALPLEPANQVFVFNTDPSQVTTLFIDVEPINLEATVEVRNSTGQAVATLGTTLDNACLSLGPGDDAHEVVVRGLPDADGEITLTLSRLPCMMGVEPTAVDVHAVPFTPLAIPDVCAASSYLNLNVRTGPGLNYEVLTLLRAQTPAQVIGVNEDHTWYVVQHIAQGATLEGWVAGSVTFLTGPCEALPIVPAPEPPAQVPTPGFNFSSGSGGQASNGEEDSPRLLPSETAVVVPTTLIPGELPTLVPTVAVPTVVEPPAGGSNATLVPDDLPTVAVPTVAVPTVVVPTLPAEPATSEPIATLVPDDPVETLSPEVVPTVAEPVEDPETLPTALAPASSSP